MKDGFLKVACCTTDIKVGDTLYNTQKIINAYNAANADGVKLIAFPEMAVCGYTVGDLVFQETLLDAVRKGIKAIAKASEGKKTLGLVGAPLERCGKIYNCAAVFCDGKILGVVPKRFLPNYSEFYEKRHFSEYAGENDTIDIDGESVPFGQKLIFTARQLKYFTVCAEICEDIWVANPPSNAHTAAGANITVNLSASNEIVGKEEYRRKMVEMQAAKTDSAYLYVSAGQGESTTDTVFSGHNLICENGTLLAQSKLFTTGTLTADVDLERLVFARRKTSSYLSDRAADYLYIPFDTEIEETRLTRTFPQYAFVPENDEERARVCDRVLRLQAEGLAARVRHTQSKNLILGISGGLDSSLALIVAVKAMQLLNRPASDVLAVTMPCFGTTTRTAGNAEKLTKAMGAQFMRVDISKAVTRHLADIQQPAGVFDAAYENAQARERTQVLMDIANQKGGFVVGTGDLSELALGWATYNGDHMSMYAVNGDVPKTLVRYLVDYTADNSPAALKRVLKDILDTPVSPELLPAEKGEITQKTEDIVGPYLLHDFFLFYAVRWGFKPSKIYRMACMSIKGYEKAEILKWMKVFYRRFFAQQFKRSCLPDGVKVGTVALSPRGDWRMPSDASAAIWLADLDSIQLD